MRYTGIAFIQSRNLRVKCQADGELPAERKAERLAVQAPHPAVPQFFEACLPNLYSKFFEEVCSMMRVFNKFSDSLGEFRSLRNLTLMAMLLALNVCLSFFSIQPFPFLKIGFSFLSLTAVGMMFGPTAGFIIGASGDLIGYFIKPTGPFNPLMTLVAAVAGLIWGLVLYKNQCGLGRVILAKTAITVICNLVMTTAILCLFFGSVFNEIFPLRVVKNLCVLPVEVAMAYFMCKALVRIQTKIQRIA